MRNHLNGVLCSEARQCSMYVFQQGENTLCTFPQCFSHPAQRHRDDLNWRSSLTLENAASVGISIEENDSTTQYLILNLMCLVRHWTLKLKTAFRYCWAREKRHLAFMSFCIFFKFKLVQRGEGCPDIVMACKTYFCLSDLLAWLCFVLSPFPAWSMDLMSYLILESCLCYNVLPLVTRLHGVCWWEETRTVQGTVSSITPRKRGRKCSCIQGHV